MERVERQGLRAFWGEIVEAAGRNVGASSKSIVVTHMLGDRPYFLEALDRVVPIACVMAKPKSIDQSAFRQVARRSKTTVANRSVLATRSGIEGVVSSHGLSQKSVIAIDIGGYFAPCLAHLAELVRLMGVVEDTENGQRKYEQVMGDEFPCPVFSAARSPLKNAEDYLVGHSVVFSAEALMRSRGDVLQGRTACVIGYGKVGRSIAQLLRSHGVLITVHDSNPIPLTEAHAHGFAVRRNLSEALSGAGIIMCATGNLALRSENFEAVQAGAYVVSVTSSDDEMELGPLKDRYERNRISADIVRYRRLSERRSEAHFFFVLNNGEAVNFLHGAVVGPAIQLVQAELVMAAGRLAGGDIEDARFAINGLSREDREMIATVWLKHFAGKVNNEH